MFLALKLVQTAAILICFVFSFSEGAPLSPPRTVFAHGPAGTVFQCMSRLRDWGAAVLSLWCSCVLWSQKAILCSRIRLHVLVLELLGPGI